jgi:glycosyltransferase involved in cell wall biosynthesis
VGELLGRADPDAIVWDYSVFDYGPRTAWDLRGTPIYAPSFGRALARARAPLLVVLHESAYGWSEQGWQRKALAAGHRGALLAVVRAADGVVVTKVQRERWLRGRRWLPSRPLARIPVCATIQPPDSSMSAPPKRPRPRIGVVGFGADDARADIVVGATRVLRDQGHDVELVLLGAPGGDGERAERWRMAARDAGCETALAFSGVLPAPEFGLALSSVDVVAFPHASGCGAGKTTLGSALALAKPVVALDGADTWEQAVREGALLSAAPTSASLAARLGNLLSDQRARASQGELGHAFFRREMHPSIGAERLLAFVDELAQVPG